ncbi:hypothetical protein HYDPIDRAFT_28320 [Hydnomerulius pinastri MD-312]|uniref:Uncharacterized protein n=1 Tax=Hydnomerulius pinastri MD-312 TaxID=994086 RepID=A0A0C9W200_9AGAM|nr:hypothetical protein HYDPIDRAFT_28320 [Hydnomerulius pinastri MD-312]
MSINAAAAAKIGSRRRVPTMTATPNPFTHPILPSIIIPAAPPLAQKSLRELTDEEAQIQAQLDALEGDDDDDMDGSQAGGAEQAQAGGAPKAPAEKRAVGKGKGKAVPKVRQRAVGNKRTTRRQRSPSISILSDERSSSPGEHEDNRDAIGALTANLDFLSNSFKEFLKMYQKDLIARSHHDRQVEKYLREIAEKTGRMEDADAEHSDPMTET